MGNEKLSIIMPLYNTVGYVEKAITSVLGQTYKDIELILIDDGSTDGSLEICKRFALIDNRVKIISKDNQGVSSARNDGLLIASGEYVTFVDSDDWIESSCYKNMMDFLEKNKADIGVMGYTVEGAYNFATHLKSCEQKIMDSRTATYEIMDGEIFTWSMGDKFYKRTLLNDIRFAMELDNGEDLLFNWQAFRAAKKIAYIPLHGYHYVQRTGSMTNSFSKKKLTVINAFDIVLNDCIYEEVLYKKVLKKYISTLVFLYADYCCAGNTAQLPSDDADVGAIKSFLIENLCIILWSDCGIKIKIAALLIACSQKIFTVIIKMHRYFVGKYDGFIRKGI